MVSKAYTDSVLRLYAPVVASRCLGTDTVWMDTVWMVAGAKTVRQLPNRAKERQRIINQSGTFELELIEAAIGKAVEVLGIFTLELRCSGYRLVEIFERSGYQRSGETGVA
jgi:hypothetical protein